MLWRLYVIELALFGGIAGGLSVIYPTIIGRLLVIAGIVAILVALLWPDPQVNGWFWNWIDKTFGETRREQNLYSVLIDSPLPEPTNLAVELRKRQRDNHLKAMLRYLRIDRGDPLTNG